MKKLRFLLSIIVLTAVMTSCLPEGSRNYSEQAFIYTVMDDSGLMYARTSTGRFITSKEIKAMSPGSFKFLAYTFDETAGSQSVGDFSVDNVIVSSDMLSIEKAIVNTTPATNEPAMKLTGLNRPIYAPDPVYFGDYWIFEYTYKHAEGDKPVVSFYKREKSDDNDVDVIIDIRLTGISGKGTTTKGNAIALDMSTIRKMYEGTSTTNTKDLKVKFYYYKEGQEELVGSQSYLFKVQGN